MRLLHSRFGLLRADISLTRPSCAKITLDSIRYNDYIWSVAKSIQAEIQQTKPFNSLEEEALVALQRTADRLQWRLSEMLKAHGLSPTQYNALRILRGAGNEGRACSEIAERMINRDPDITRLVDRLERRGLAARSREGRDRRVITTRITPAGLNCWSPWTARSKTLTARCLAPWGAAVADADPASGSGERAD